MFLSVTLPSSAGQLCLLAHAAVAVVLSVTLPSSAGQLRLLAHAAVAVFLSVTLPSSAGQLCLLAQAAHAAVAVFYFVTVPYSAGQLTYICLHNLRTQLRQCRWEISGWKSPRGGIGSLEPMLAENRQTGVYTCSIISV